MFAPLIRTALTVAPPVVASSGSSETWNPADKTAGVTLSNSNRTATATGADGVRGTPGFTGKKYWEYLVGSTAGNYVLGVADSSATLDTTAGFIGESGNSHGAGYSFDGGGNANGATLGSTPTYAPGDVIGIATDQTGLLVWFAKNNAWLFSGDPAAGTNGKSISNCSGSLYPIFQSKFGTSVATYQATNTYSPPSGFTAL